MTPHRVDFNEILWESPMKGLRFKALRQSGRQLRLVEYTPEMEPHWCEKGHIGYVLTGQFEIRFPGDVQIFKEGDGVFIPAGPEHKHMGRALTDVVRAVFVEDV
ncbi:MAG: cupin domain-containing protein [Ignavibacteria bacterium]|nr:cupin domain-containing protein [Ignavibacteria bacterium]